MHQVAFAGFVLAAGLGTRIAQLSQLRPKPLLPIGHTNAFADAVARLRTGGALRVVANASHLPEQVIEAGKTLDVEVVVEPDGPLGTAGGLAGARARLDADEVAIWNGDIVADFDVAALRAALGARDLAVLAVRDRLSPGSGNVGVAADGRIVRLRNRAHPALGAEVRGAWFAAVHVMKREVVRRAPARGCLIGDVYMPLLEEGARLIAHDVSGRWHDVGDLPSYLEANLDALGGESQRVGARASVAAGVQLDRAVIGANAIVEGSGALRSVVVWPGARAIAPATRAIFVGDGTRVDVASTAGA